MEKAWKIVIIIATAGLVCGAAGFMMMAAEPADFEVTAQSFSIDEEGHVVLHGDIMSNRGDEAITVRVHCTIYDDPTGRSYDGSCYVTEIPRLASKYWDYDTGVFATDPSQVRVTVNYKAI